MYNGHIILTLLLVTAFPSILHGITTTHHDKPEESTISKMVNKMTDRVPSTKLSDRHKRLLPYINYYVSHNQRKPNREKFTPFLESNALPGPFIPIVKSTPKQQLVVQYSPGPPVPEKSPNYGAIYDTLVQLKQAQEAMRIKLTPVYQKPPIEYVPISYYNEPPTKTVVESYTPTNIDIDIDARKKYELLPNVEYKIYRHKPQIVDSYVLDRPIHDYRTQTANADQYFADKPIFVYQEKPVEHTQNEKPLTYGVETTPKSQVNTIVDDKYIAQKFTPVHTTQETVYPPVQYVSEKPNYVQYYSSPTPIVPTENTNVLAKLLKQLQNSNMLPQTFTPQNIDNSIKTLVKILNGLTKQSRLKTKPIVVVQEDSHEERVQENAEITEKPFDEKPQYTPVSFTQVFPANTIDGGTPGRPGIDYPALSSIPQTDFNCKKQRYKGFFGDPHTNCQVWHYCDLNGGQASFLCPNGTIFSQVALTCDWWYNVKCSSTAQLYVLNERLYKYILPLSPKFPEDYSGPLVDRYLALKFQEMEEKMKKERKKQDKTEEEKDDSDQLQELRNEKEKSSEES